jgi:hypothetical protein
MNLATVLIYILLILGIALVALGIFVVARQLLRSDTSSAAAGAPGPYLSALVIVIGIASLGTSGFLSQRNTASQVTAQPKPTTPAASPAPHGPPTPAVPSSKPASPVPAGTVTLSARPGTNVQQCDVFSGTANLPASKTIAVGVRNLSDADHTTYLEPIDNWETPSALARWTDVQYFGSGNTSVGQTYLVSVIVLPSGTVKRALADPANHVAWGVTSLPRGATVRQTLHLTRIPGSGAC